MFFFVYMVVMMLSLYFIFFFKHKTAYGIRISDWSSDVCSSDLDPADRAPDADRREFLAGVVDRVEGDRRRERDRRGVEEEMEQAAEQEQRRRTLDGRHPEQRPAGAEREDAEQFLCGDETVSDHADEQRGHDRRDPDEAERRADDRIEMQPLAHIGAERNEPHAPREIMREHHHREAQFHHAQATSSMRPKHGFGCLIPEWTPDDLKLPQIGRAHV